MVYTLHHKTLSLDFSTLSLSTNGKRFIPKGEAIPTDLFAELSHCLRTPLFNILSFKELADNESALKEHEDILKNIQDTGERFTGLIDRLHGELFSDALLQEIRSFLNDFLNSETKFREAVKECILDENMNKELCNAYNRLTDYLEFLQQDKGKALYEALSGRTWIGA